jgi:hypothetical protein
MTAHQHKHLELTEQQKAFLDSSIGNNGYLVGMLKNNPRWLYDLTKKILEDESVGGESYSINKVSIHPRRYILQTTHRIRDVKERVLSTLQDKLNRHEIEQGDYDYLGSVVAENLDSLEKTYHNYISIFHQHNKKRLGAQEHL